MFGKTWLSGEATIVAVNIKRVSGDGLTPTREFAADLRIAGREPVRVRLDEARWTADFWPPSVGDVVNVLQDEKSGAVKFDMKDPRLSVKHHDDSRGGSFAATLAAAPAAADPAATQPSQEQLAALIANAQVLQANDPATAALRDSILKAMKDGQAGPSV
ncbi:MAG: hypothetical protein ABJB03_02330 [Rhodoglobus sp.]